MATSELRVFSIIICALLAHNICTQLAGASFIGNSRSGLNETQRHENLHNVRQLYNSEKKRGQVGLHNSASTQEQARPEVKINHWKIIPNVMNQLRISNGFPVGVEHKQISQITRENSDNRKTNNRREQLSKETHLHMTSEHSVRFDVDRNVDVIDNKLNKSTKVTHGTAIQSLVPIQSHKNMTTRMFPKAADVNVNVYHRNIIQNVETRPHREHPERGRRMRSIGRRVASRTGRQQLRRALTRLVDTLSDEELVKLTEDTATIRPSVVTTTTTTTTTTKYTECDFTEDGFRRIVCATPDGTGKYPCIDEHQLCDQQIHCPGGEDENPVACMFHRSTANNVRALTDAVTMVTDRSDLRRFFEQH